MAQLFENPFRPGAGQPPPHLAGRENEKNEFIKLLSQKPVIKNLIITGLRGVGKTVFLETLKPIAIQEGWFWAGADFSEQASVSEFNLSTRVLTDLSALASSFAMTEDDRMSVGFAQTVERAEIKLNYHTLMSIYSHTPGLDSDKLKKILEIIWAAIKTKVKGIVLAYDEAQILKDKASDKQYPLSLLLEVTQYLQKKGIPYLLVLTGLPTLFPNLVEARTYAERMFQVINLGSLTDEASAEAIKKPIEREDCPVSFGDAGIKEIIRLTSGYPYFIQFFCKEIFDQYLQQVKIGIENPNISSEDIIHKLDIDFYSGRWSRVTDRQKELLSVIAKLPDANKEFTVKEVAKKSLEIKGKKPFKAAYINNLLIKLIDAGLIYKDRRSKYLFAVPLLAEYINRLERQEVEEDAAAF